MNAYLVYQTQHIERARTLADIRRIEERLTWTVQAAAEAQDAPHATVWPFGAMVARRRRHAVQSDRIAA